MFKEFADFERTLVKYKYLDGPEIQGSKIAREIVNAYQAYWAEKAKRKKEA